MIYVNTSRSGFGLMEAMVATAFTGIALAGAFSLSSASRAALQQAHVRSELMMVSDDIFEQLRADLMHIDDYHMDLGITASQCEALASDISTTAKQYRFQWCRRLEAIAPYQFGEIRTVTVSISDTGLRNIDIILQASSGSASLPAEVLAVRRFDIPEGSS